MLVAFRFAILMFILGGLVYPLSVTAIGQALFPQQANGSLIHKKTGEVSGSILLGQAFTQPQYFLPRPAANGYDAANSGGSNFGPTSKKLVDRVQKDAATYSRDNDTTVVPGDAVTASASNLDPDITLANAYAQVNRIAATRHISAAQVQSLVDATRDNTAYAPFAVARVNVLALNMALDEKVKQKN